MHEMALEKMVSIDARSGMNLLTFSFTTSIGWCWNVSLPMTLELLRPAEAIRSDRYLPA